MKYLLLQITVPISRVCITYFCRQLYLFRQCEIPTFADNCTYFTSVHYLLLQITIPILPICKTIFGDNYLFHQYELPTFANKCTYCSMNYLVLQITVPFVVIRKSGNVLLKYQNSCVVQIQFLSVNEKWDEFSRTVSLHDGK